MRTTSLGLGFTIEEHSYAPTCRCPRPGWWRRRQLGLKLGAKIRCARCGQRWQYKSGYDWVGWEKVK